jgi:1-acyl-sn-glycerol-3-phosphate acyltransferase
MATVETRALARYDRDRPRGLLGFVRQKMEKWAVDLGGQELESRLARLVAPQNEYGVDPFGLELEFARAAIAPVLWLYKHYFRVETRGIENVPAGRVMLLANHSGQLPLDGAMICASMLLEAEPPRVARAMVEKWAPTLPYVAPFFARIGQVVGTPENCRRLLAAGETILVFPEGVRGLNKTYDKAYRLQEFGTGFMRLAVSTRTPIVPVAVIGAEEQAPAILDFKRTARFLGLPALPLTVPLPLPVKYHLRFGEPMLFEGNAEEGDHELARKVGEVKTRLQAMVDQGVAERRSIF